MNGAAAPSRAPGELGGWGKAKFRHVKDSLDALGDRKVGYTSENRSVAHDVAKGGRGRVISRIFFLYWKLLGRDDISVRSPIGKNGVAKFRHPLQQKGRRCCI